MSLAAPGVVALPADALIDRELVRAWLAWGFVWLLVFPTLGAVVVVKFSDPGFLDGVPWLSFGRLLPVHVNGVIWGAFSTLFIGLAHYLVPRLCGARLWQERWSRPLLWVWNLNIGVGSLLLLLGSNRGWEVGEYPLATVIVLLLVLLALTVQFLATIGRRTEPTLYVSLWYLMAAFVWTDVNLVLLILGPLSIPGISNAAWHGLFIHSIVGLWITPAGYVLVYYFLPASVRTPISSHALALVGFWSLALFYPLVGIHAYLEVPIAEWARTTAFVSSLLLVVPAWTVLQNVFGTMSGASVALRRNLPAKLLITGSLVYLGGCLQSTVEALRVLQPPTHFTDFVVAHPEVTIVGTFVLWALAGVLYVWPRITGA
ncbi:MAG: cbb3-type cytochrome c oxidase subunit I, partial [Candidatus Rokuibacteriota bacterium]